jgi:hypothetical protein
MASEADTTSHSEIRNMNPATDQPVRHDLMEKRKALHGQRRDLHERLSDVCEEFVAGPLTKDYRRSALVRELRYLLDYYQDDASWDGVE